ncbi:uncharacterized protein LOC141850508 [Brevipalpus obovatus]|uniref:uncharacterized protein LOC141850508 n=1 Tax=Brevipalpus obovatus TaxID=246614 RepID=UPI003D9E1ACC
MKRKSHKKSSIQDDHHDKSSGKLNLDTEFIYSKLDTGGEEPKETSKVVPRKKKLLKSLNQIQQKEKKIEKLVEKGKVNIAEKLKEEELWNKALARCRGEKIRDDPKKIARTLKREQKTKIRHSKKWKERKQHVEDKMERRQKRRQKNIKAKSEQKKKKKMQKLRKKGKIID